LLRREMSRLAQSVIRGAATFLVAI